MYVRGRREIRRERVLEEKQTQVTVRWWGSFLVRTGNTERREEGAKSKREEDEFYCDTCTVVVLANS